MRKFTFKQTAISVLVAGFLAGCGGASQDDGVGDVSTSLNGLVIDGYLARAVVFVDSNENGELDAPELFALTDNDGYYSTSKPSSTQGEGQVEDPDNPGKYYTDYCALPESNLASIHCLRTTHGDSRAIIRIVGGYDILTGEKFEGTMSVKVTDFEVGKPVKNKVITPLTTLVATSEDSEAMVEKLKTAGLIETEEDLNKDFLAEETYDPKLAAANVEVQKVVELLTKKFGDTYTEYEDIQDDKTFETLVYDKVVKVLSEKPANSFSPTAPLLNEDDLNDVVDDVDGELTQTYQSTNQTNVPSTSSSQKAKLANDTSKVTTLADSLLKNTSTPKEATAKSRAVEVVSQKVKKDAPTSEVDSAIALTDNTDYIDNLGEENVDLGLLIADPFSDTENLINQVVLPNDAVIQNNLAGKAIGIHLLNSQLQPSVAQHSAVTKAPYVGSNGLTRTNVVSGEEAFIVAYFLDTQSTSEKGGPLKACIYYQTSGDINNNTTGSVFKGSWSRLSNTRLLIDMEIGVGRSSAILSSVGYSNDAQANRYRFDFGGALTDWGSTNGVVDISDSGIPLPNDYANYGTEDKNCAWLADEYRPSVLRQGVTDTRP